MSDLLAAIGSWTGSSALTIAVLAGVGFLAKNSILERIKASVRAEYDEKLERLKADLQRENASALATQRAQLEKQGSEALARLRKDLDVLKEKELGGHRDKLQIYRLVVDVLAELYADIFKANTENSLQSVADKYNRGWIRCYGYLSMLASQDVMDAFDSVNDYVLQLLSGRVEPQPWAETRKQALALVNAIRRDVGFDESPIAYRGRL